MSVIDGMRQQSHALRLQNREPWVVLLGQRQTKELERWFLVHWGFMGNIALLEGLGGQGGLDGYKWDDATIVTVDVPDLLQVKMNPYHKGEKKEL